MSSGHLQGDDTRIKLKLNVSPSLYDIKQNVISVKLYFFFIITLRWPDYWPNHVGEDTINNNTS